MSSEDFRCFFHYFCSPVHLLSDLLGVSWATLSCLGLWNKKNAHLCKFSLKFLIKREIEGRDDEMGVKLQHQQLSLWGVWTAGGYYGTRMLRVIKRALFLFVLHFFSLLSALKVQRSVGVVFIPFKCTWKVFTCHSFKFRVLNMHVGTVLWLSLLSPRVATLEFCSLWLVQLLHF